MGLFSSKDDSTERDLEQHRYMTAQSAANAMHPLMLNNDQTSRELAEYAIDNSELIEVFKNKLRRIYPRKVYNKDTGLDVIEFVSVGEPVLNERGVNDIATFVSSHMHKNTVLMKLQDSNSMMRAAQEIHMSIVKHLLKYKQDYGFDVHNMDFVVEEATNIILFCMSRGLERGEANLMYKGKKEIFTHSSDDYARYMAQKGNGGFLRGF